MAAAITVSASLISSEWNASPVTTRTGSLEQLQQFIPRFQRCSFGPSLLPLPVTLMIAANLTHQ